MSEWEYQDILIQLIPLSGWIWNAALVVESVMIERACYDAAGSGGWTQSVRESWSMIEKMATITSDHGKGEMGERQRVEVSTRESEDVTSMRSVQPITSPQVAPPLARLGIVYNASDLVPAP